MSLGCLEQEQQQGPARGQQLLGKSLQESLPSLLRGSEEITSKGLHSEAGTVSTRASCHYSYFLLSAMMLM